VIKLTRDDNGDWSTEITLSHSCTASIFKGSKEAVQEAIQHILHQASAIGYEFGFRLESTRILMGATPPSPAPEQPND
jgi:hypothetical protein